MDDGLAKTLKSLRLYGLHAHWDEYLERARRERFSPVRLLQHVIEEEYKIKQENARERRLAQAMLVLYVVQVVVGALNVWYTFPDPLTVSHTVIASGVWVSLATTVILSFYSPSVETTPRPVTRVGVPA